VNSRAQATYPAPGDIRTDYANGDALDYKTTTNPWEDRNEVEDWGFRNTAKWASGGAAQRHVKSHAQVRYPAPGDIRTDYANGDALDYKTTTNPWEDRNEVEDWGFRNTAKWATGGAAQKGRRLGLSQYENTEDPEGVITGWDADEVPLEYEENPDHFVVDYNGHTKEGYGSKNVAQWNAVNLPGNRESIQNPHSSFV